MIARIALENRPPSCEINGAVPLRAAEYVAAAFIEVTSSAGARQLPNQSTKRKRPRQKMRTFCEPR